MTITSKEVAEMLGKRHDNLLRAIRKYITQLGDEAPKYFSEDPDKGGRLYHITKAGCDLMAGRIIGAQSEAFKAMVIFGSSKEELHKLKRELDEFMAVNLKQVLKHNWQVFPTKVRGVDFVGYRFFGEYTLLRKSTCKTFKRRMLSISSKRENNVSPTYSEWCSFNSYVGWLQHCDSFRLYQKYVEPNVEYMHNYYLKEVKGNAEICKRKNYSGERKAS